MASRLRGGRAVIGLAVQVGSKRSYDVEVTCPVVVIVATRTRVEVQVLLPAR